MFGTVIVIQWDNLLVFNGTHNSVDKNFVGQFGRRVSKPRTEHGHQRCGKRLTSKGQSAAAREERT
jgi:hypothetical protein